MRFSASSATSESSAATAATFSPTNRTLSTAKGGTSCNTRPSSIPVMSLPVITACTPGTVAAREASMLTILAWAYGLLSTFPMAMPGNITSAEYR